MDDLGELAPAPTLYGNEHFFKPVCNIVKSYLPRAAELPALDGDTTRFLLRFACGNVLDFRTGQVRPCKPEDRISMSTGYRFPAFNACPDHKQMISNLLHKTVQFWKQGGTDLYESDFLWLFDAVLAFSLFLQLFYGLTGDWNIAMWMVCQTVRAAAAIPKFEEFVWFSASRGNNGKGTWIALFMGLLGMEKDGYFGKLDFETHFVGKGMRGKNVNNPDIAAIQGKRFVCVNEAAQSSSCEPLNVNLTKQLASLDDLMQAAAKYKDPAMWTPMCLLAFFANKAPTFPSDDGGVKSRLSYLFMKYTFVADPDPENDEKPLDTSIKENAKAGVYNAEALLWMTGTLTNYLASISCSRQILPRPEKVIDDSMSHFQVAGEGPNPKETAQALLSEKLIEWKKELGEPSGRLAINAAFKVYAQQKGLDVNPQEVLPGVLFAQTAKTRFKVTFEKKDIAVYKAVIDGIMKVVTLKQ